MTVAGTGAGCVASWQQGYETADKRSSGSSLHGILMHSRPRSRLGVPVYLYKGILVYRTVIMVARTSCEFS
jgi:hypothetical protein